MKKTAVFNLDHTEVAAAIVNFIQKKEKVNNGEMIDFHIEFKITRSDKITIDGATVTATKK